MISIIIIIICCSRKMGSRLNRDFPGGLVVKNLLANAGDLGLIPGSERSSAAGNGNPFQYSSWKIPWTEEPGGLQSGGSQWVGGNRAHIACVVVVVQVRSRVWLFCNPMHCSSPGSSVHGVSQARILEWVSISFSRGSSPPMDQTCVAFIGR